MNFKLLNEEIKKSGIKKKIIAERMGFSAYTFQMKLESKRKFYVEEAEKISQILSLTSEKRDEIFFNNFVDNLSTIKEKR